MYTTDVAFQKKEKKREQETRKVYTDNFLICCVAIHFFYLIFTILINAFQ